MSCSPQSIIVYSAFQTMALPTEYIQNKSVHPALHPGLPPRDHWHRHASRSKTRRPDCLLLHRLPRLARLCLFTRSLAFLKHLQLLALSDGLHLSIWLPARHSFQLCGTPEPGSSQIHRRHCLAWNPAVDFCYSESHAQYSLPTGSPCFHLFLQARPLCSPWSHHSGL